MKNHLKAILLTLSTFLGTALLCSCDSKPAGQATATAQKETAQGVAAASDTSANKSSPASVAQATASLDLSNIALVPKAETPSDRTLASLTYQAPIAVTEGYKFYQQKLTELGWTEAEGSYITEDSSSGVFLKNSFKVSVTVMPSGNPGVANFMLLQHGNIDLKTVNLAPNLSAVVTMPLIAMYTTSATPSEAAESAKTKLLSTGWVPYGYAGDSKYYKQNAVRLSVTSSSAPAQDGKTMLSLESILMSADIPSPPQIEDPRYTDTLKRLSFEGELSKEEILKFYSESLPKLEWKSSSATGTMIDDWEVYSWRNPGKDLLTLSFWKGTGQFLRVYVQVKTAQEIADMNKRLDEQAAAYKAKNAKQ